MELNRNSKTLTSFQKWGVGFGLSLTVWIYSTIIITYIEKGGFHIDADEVLWTSFAFLMWVSNIILEIWTLDPIRKKESKTQEEQIKAEKKLKTHLFVLIERSIATLGQQ